MQKEPLTLSSKVTNRPRVSLCDDVLAYLAALENTQSDPSLRRITLLLSPIPRLGSIIDEVIKNLAEIALALWPHWYGTRVDNPDLLPKQMRAEKPLSIPWLRAARKLCNKNNLPLPERYHPGMQVVQLSLAISPGQLTIVLAITQAKHSGQTLLGLARATEWLAKESGAQIQVLLPQELSTHIALDSILYGAESITTLGTNNTTKNHNLSPESRYRVFPVVGQPHPFSPGEQMLAKAIQSEPSLAELFEFNQFVDTIKGSRFLVDLLWRNGKLVIEIDSYTYHSSKAVFASDRHRDYELLISDYTILRLTHDEVINDVEKTIRKIDELVIKQRLLVQNQELQNYELHAKP